MKKVRVVDSFVTEIFARLDGFQITDCFVPEVVALFEDAPDEVQIGWVKHADGSFTAPVNPVIPVTVMESPT
jgi:methyl coenzyme M reductase gamma subunit